MSKYNFKSASISKKVKCEEKHKITFEVSLDDAKKLDELAFKKGMRMNLVARKILIDELNKVAQ